MLSLISDKSEIETIKDALLFQVEHWTAMFCSHTATEHELELFIKTSIVLKKLETVLEKTIDQ